MTVKAASWRVWKTRVSNSASSPTALTRHSDEVAVVAVFLPFVPPAAPEKYKGL